LTGLIKNNWFKAVSKVLVEQGVDGALLSTTWRALYLVGYHAQKHLGRWSVVD